MNERSWWAGFFLMLAGASLIAFMWLSQENAPVWQRAAAAAAGLCFGGVAVWLQRKGARP